MRTVHSVFSQQRRNAVARITLTGVSLASLTVAAFAQDATSPRRGVSSPPAEATVQLQELNVEGTGRGNGLGGLGGGAVRAVESPTGPVDGYVATRSATATKTNTPLIETPQSISVVGRQQIDAQKAQTLTQATQYVPGLYSGTFGADSRLDYFTLRGFVASDYGLYRDGLQLLNYGFAYFRTDTFGLERIEVLRGPAAVLFGAGTPGGLINQVTKRPPLDPLRYIEVGGGAFGQGGFGYAAFDVGGPSDADGHWFYRLTGIGRVGGNQVEGAPEDRGYIAPAITYKPDGATKLTILTSFQYDNAAVTANFLPYSGTVRPNLSGFRIPRSLNVGDANLNTFRREQALAGYEFEHAFNETWTFRQNLRYSFVDSFQNSYIGNGYTAGTAETSLSRYQFRDSARAALFQVDNQAEARFFDGFFRHDLLLGLDYKNYNLHDNQASTFPGPDLNLLFPVSGLRVATPSPYLINANSFEQLGLYAQDQIKLTDQLSLVLGLRQDFADNRIRNLLTPSASNGRSDNALTYRTALIYNFDFGLAPYVSYSTSFQPQIGTDVTGQGFRPETGDQIEGGVKFEPPGQGYFLTLAGFDIQRQGVLVPNPASPFFSIQSGIVRSTGFEAQLTVNLAEGLNAVAAFTTYDLVTTRDADPARVGRTPTNIPETFASAFFDYTIPVGEWRGFGFGGGVRYIGSSFADVANTLKVSDYVLFDAQVHYNWENWRIAVNATNIGDRRFVSSCQSTTACFYGDARRVVASLSYKW
ncbi:TonB-dependent siderophore receptor [Methylobacterium planeticum]|uniref:TonB-dependent siderophore receptor n=1 Tax=Methylobacterium planeticum TaxID=2615211 RepID=A0A6N6MTB2_9HYPH|nr:TonB-dependent siderophore receptor [Methylobacterium planeticum]KAB1073857.1 TonB-dependent siderophore receptor [Methylobacterium planeticum]